MRRGVVAAICLILAVGVQGCSSEERNVSRQTQGQIEKNIFIIGEIMSETGGFAECGRSMYEGTVLAVNEINLAGGVKIGEESYQLKLITEDDVSNEEMAENAYNTLKDKGAQAMIGAVSDASCRVIEKKANADNLLLLLPAAKSQETGTFDNTFRIGLSDIREGEEIADYAYYQLNGKSAALLYSAQDTGIAEAFMEGFMENGGNIIAREQYGDLEGILSNVNSIEAAGPDVVFIPGKADFIHDILSIMDGSRMKVSVVGDARCYGLEAGVYQNLKQIAYLSPFGQDITKFLSDYQKKYERLPDAYAGTGYDSVYTIKSALEEAGNVDSDLQICAMTKLCFDGVTGKNISFNEGGENCREVIFQKVQDK